MNEENTILQIIDEIQPIIYYTDINNICHKPIFHTLDNNLNITHGFYFSDETYSDYYGPYSTLDECIEKLNNYAKTL